MRPMGIRVGNITVDCGDVMRVAAFWSAAMERPLDDGASERRSSSCNPSEEDGSPLGPTEREQEDMRPLGNRS